MEEQERQSILDQLTSTRDRVLKVVDGLTPEQWTFRPAEGRWSIGECLEHITLVENRVTGLIGNKLSEGAPEAEKQNVERISDALLTQSLLDRTNGRKAPEAIQPSGQWGNSNELLTQFQSARQRTAEFAANTQADLRRYFHPHGAFGQLDCYQWLIAISFHGVRHAQQMEEIKAAPGFPN
jgi:hypothetical protein